MVAEPSLQDLAREARLYRNLLLADRRSAAAEDLRDCAATLVNAGYIAPAELLLDAAALWVGINPKVAPTDGAAKQGAAKWDGALDELSDLISLSEDMPPLHEEDAVRLALRGDDARADAVMPPESSWMSEFGPALKDLLSVRDRRPTEGGETTTLVEKAFQSAPFQLETLGREPVKLASALAFNVTRRTLVERGEIARAPYGCPALFERCERLTVFGLGVGFRNLFFLEPSQSELELLITEAWGRQGRKGDLATAVDRFTVLLSTGLSALTQRRLVGSLADKGSFAALVGMLIRAQRAPLDLSHPDLLRDLRDAFLDLARLPLAIAAQQRLTALSGDHPAELAALDSLEASCRRHEPLKSGVSHGEPSDRSRSVFRLSAYYSTATQRKRRFRHAIADRTEARNSYAAL